MNLEILEALYPDNLKIEGVEPLRIVLRKPVSATAPTHSRRRTRRRYRELELVDLGQQMWGIGFSYLGTSMRTVLGIKSIPRTLMRSGQARVRECDVPRHLEYHAGISTSLWRQRRIAALREVFLALLAPWDHPETTAYLLSYHDPDVREALTLRL